MDLAAWEAAGLYDRDAPDAVERRELLDYLASVGCTVDEMVAHTDGLIRLASRRILFGSEEPVTVAHLAEVAGCSEELARRVRLAVGLPDPGDAEVCSPIEATILESFVSGAAVFGDEVTLQFTRVVGNAVSGIAEAALALFAANRSAPLVADGATPADVARAGAEATEALLAVPPLLDVLLRVHFEAASLDRFSGGDGRGPTVSVAVAFVDLVGSTQLTHLLTGAELAAALGDFERVASEAVVAVGGRIVKRIGDAVMFVASDAVSACDAARAVVAAVDAHPTLSAARAAVAWGSVLPRDGDYFGTPVNLAARAVPFAEPGTVVVSEAVRDFLLAAAPPIAVVPLGEPVLKGFDTPVALFALRPPGAAELE
jgi:adenylate cyclase